MSLRDQWRGDPKTMHPELRNGSIEIKQAAAMGFGDDSKDASHLETEREGDCPSAFLIEQKKAILAMLPCEHDGSRFAGIEDGGFRHRAGYFFNHEKRRKRGQKRLSQDFRRSSVKALAKHGIRNDDLREERLQKPEASEQRKVAEDRSVADDNGHAFKGESSAARVSGS